MFNDLHAFHKLLWIQIFKGNIKKICTVLSIKSIANIHLLLSESDQYAYMTHYKITIKRYPTT